MKRCDYRNLALALACLFVTSVAHAAHFTLAFDENGNNFERNDDSGVMFSVHFFKGADPSEPGNGQLPLVYDLGTRVPGLTNGDVQMFDGPGGPVFDVIRFANLGGHQYVIFYSDNVDGFDDLADTFGPPTPGAN